MDFQFFIKQHHFQIGWLISDNDFLQVNNASLHTGYGWRKETAKTNLALFTGLNYSYGVYGVLDTGTVTKPVYYGNLGIYACAQAIVKFTYDIGGGIEAYAEINKTQAMGGIKFILFFSNAYRGQKRNYNPNVKQKK